MPTPFAALQTKLIDAQVKHLSDTTLSINAVDVDGILTNEPIEVNFVQTLATTFTFRSADVDVYVDDLVVNGMDVYLVKNLIPDGTGIMKLILEKQDG